MTGTAEPLPDGRELSDVDRVVEVRSDDVEVVVSAAEGVPPPVAMTAYVSGQGQAYLAGRDLHIHQAPEAARVVPPEGSRAAAIAAGLVLGFQSSAVLTGLVARSKRARWLSVTGSAGSGKSTVLAALAKPDLCLGQVPEDFVDAIVFCDATTTVESLGLELRDQLLSGVKGFKEALAAHYAADPKGWTDQNALTRYVAGPLASLDGERLVRLVIDGLDQLREDSGDLPVVLSGIAEDETLEHLRLIVGHRPDEELARPVKASTMVIDSEALSASTVTALSAYLGSRGLQVGAARILAESCARAGSGWLAARLIADVYADLDSVGRDEIDRLLADPWQRPGALAWLYERRLAQVDGWVSSGSDSAPEAGWRYRLRPVLTALTVVGAGPLAPLTLLAAVSREFAGPGDEAGIRSVLYELDRLIVRIHAGTDRELVGLFHPTLVEHLSGTASHRLDLVQGRRMLLERIDELAPVTGIYIDNPLYRWARTAQAEHYWQLGLAETAYEALKRRELPTPRENLERWQAWLPRFQHRLGPDHELIFSVRYQIASWTGQAGDPEGAVRLYQELMPDLRRVLGARHIETLLNQAHIATWTGMAGRPAEALERAQALFLGLEAEAGAKHQAVLALRGNIATWIGKVGDAEGALQAFKELLPDLVGKKPEDHLAVLTCRHNIAGWTGSAGNPALAERLFRELLPERQLLLGPDHPEVLSTRVNIAHWTAEGGRPYEALKLLREVLDDRNRVLGASHPYVINTQSLIDQLAARLSDSPSISESAEQTVSEPPE